MIPQVNPVFPSIFSKWEQINNFSRPEEALLTKIKTKRSDSWQRSAITGGGYYDFSSHMLNFSRHFNIYIYLFPDFSSNPYLCSAEAYNSTEPWLVNTGLTFQDTVVNIRTVPST